MMRHKVRPPLIVFAITLGLSILFACLPTDQQTNALTWLVIALVSLSTIYVSLAWQRRLSRWRGWLGVVIGLFISLEWLRLQWFATEPIVQHINIAIAMWAWALLIAVFISSILMLIYRGASVIFMGLAWLIVPIILLAMGALYGTSIRMDNAPLNGKLVLGVPLWWAICIGSVSLPIFLLQLLLVIRKEINAR